MYKIVTNQNNKLAVLGQHGDETIHVIHCSETIEELREETANLYIVFEYCTNFARMHLVADRSEDEALQQVYYYLIEEEEEEEEEIYFISVEEVEI